jgi:hypothetical protein
MRFGRMEPAKDLFRIKEYVDKGEYCEIHYG